MDNTRRFFVPEVVQTSEMDCGPASLKALLEGYGVPVSYGRLREACHTSVDGTNIDTIEEIAISLGLEAEQIMLPVDHLLLEESGALPAMVVTRTPGGMTHFVVLWQRHGKFLQVMDPAVGRRWVTIERFIDQLYIHQFAVSAADWRAWAGTDEFLAPLRRRMADLQIPISQRETLITAAVQDPAWRTLAALDAGVRMLAALVRSGGLLPGSETGNALARLLERQAAQTGDSQPGFIPWEYWSIIPSTPTPQDGETATLIGPVLIKVSGAHPATRPAQAPPLAPELQAALKEPSPQPLRELWHLLKQDGLFAPGLLLAALGLTSLGVLLQGLLFQGMMNLTKIFGEGQPRFRALLTLLVFLFVMALIEIPLRALLQRIARRLEARLRLRFLEKLPLLGDSYFHSRLTADMVQRAHSLRQIHDLSGLGVSLVQTLFQIVLTTAGIVWLRPQSAPLAILALLVFAGLSVLFNPLYQESDLRLQTHIGALSRFYLESLLGLLPLRTHGAERTFRREQEGLVVEWARASLDAARLETAYQAVQALLYSAFAVWLMFSTFTSSAVGGISLLLLYWTLNLPTLGQALIGYVKVYPFVRNTVLRLLEVLSAPEETPAGVLHSVQPLAGPQKGVAIRFENVQVEIGGRAILQGINLSLAAGEHIAIVGPSGAGKSTLVGLLLGWRSAAGGACLVDGQPLDTERLFALRRVTAWVDPAVQLWNRTLLENLQYGSDERRPGSLEESLERSGLYAVLERLENGMQTPLGESGGLVSGGEGQRVRLGRAFNRPGTRLVILDEPFRGLDRENRRLLLAAAREYWKDITLICITHDVGETQAFERVAVVENGAIIEEGVPAALAKKRTSRYHAMLVAEEAVRSGMWQGEVWQRLWMDSGKLQERKNPEKPLSGVKNLTKDIDQINEKPDIQ